MPWHPALDRLRDALAELYPDVEDARRIAATASLPIHRLVLQGKAVNVWQSILEEAEKQRRVEAVMAAAEADYPQHLALRAAGEAYRRVMAQKPPSPAPGDGAPGGRPVLLDLIDYALSLVRVPAGAFLMGSGPTVEAPRYERPSHELWLPDYLIGQYPVTVGQYRAFVRSGHAEEHTAESLARPNDHPVGHVTWYEANRFCGWASEVSGRKVRLPSEAEWEKAARWDEAAQHARAYPWGDEWDPARCNTKEAGPGATTPVGRYSPQGDSPYGCADMAGNVDEWTRSLWGTHFLAALAPASLPYELPFGDIFARVAATQAKSEFYRYPYDPRDGREYLGAGVDVYRVVRGGSYGGTGESARCARRAPAGPKSHEPWRGFRVVVPLGES